MNYKQYDAVQVEGVVDFFGKNQFNRNKEPQFALKVITPDGDVVCYYSKMEYCNVFPRKGERVSFKVYGRVFSSLKAEYSHGEI